ncbi:MerR family transcriptional regulator [Demequina gelatinilytica]|uniref:MerR family transcriptional regulator n=1 Tax=Demequina gelatinilytica TaxID=1638980 RepID=UPI00078605DB|nr:MerR family transcriptional regulator [Demequina gelatinilytica]
MDLDIAAVARLTGVTSRTLRHYDAIGLLTPARTGHDGRRFYGDAQLLRLQHILVLRELEVPLDTIASIVDTDDATLTSALMRDHHVALLARRDRFAALAETVERTITRIEKGLPMTADDMFEGFDHTAYEPEARERWGDDAVARSNAAWASLDKADQRAHLAEHEAIAEALGRLAAADADPASDEVQALVARHHAWVSLFWTPGREAYTGLGATYADDARFRATYDKHGDGTAVLLRDAIAVYAQSLHD